MSPAEMMGNEVVEQALTTLPRLTGAADECEVLREQLDYLMDCAAEHSYCDCSECRRFLQVRSILLAIFGEPRTPEPREMLCLPRAA